MSAQVGLPGIAQERDDDRVTREAFETELVAAGECVECWYVRATCPEHMAVPTEAVDA